MRINRSLTPLVLLVVMAALLIAVADAGATYTVKNVWARISATAGETLATGDAVMIKDADGYAYKADANDAALRPAVGVVGKGAASGAKVEIIVFGIVSGWTTLSEGQPGYLSETAGAITQSAPAYSQQLGYAISTTEYLINCQNYFDSSSLTVLGTLSGATPLVFEGATADDFETTIAVTDPTADRTVTLADASGTVMLSTLATNAPDAANSVTGASNGLVFEGATADAFETTLTVVDPTADRTITLPNSTGTVAMISGTGAIKTFTIVTDNTVLTTADCGKVIGIGTDAKTITLPATVAGCTYTFVNTGAAGNNIIELVPDAADQVFGTVTLAASVVVIAGAAGEHVLNTKATSKRGDAMSLIGDGVDGWYITSSTGIWAEATP